MCTTGSLVVRTVCSFPGLVLLVVSRPKSHSSERRFTSFLQDNFVDEPVAEDYSGLVDGRAAECIGMVNSKAAADAVKVAIAQPPLGADEATRHKNYMTVMQVLTAVKSSDVAETVATLDQVREREHGVRSVSE